MYSYLPDGFKLLRVECKPRPVEGAMGGLELPLVLGEGQEPGLGPLTLLAEV